MGVNHKEQYALTLAVGDSNSEKMTEKEHVMLWNDEYPADGIVYHVGNTLEKLIQADSGTLRQDIASRFISLVRQNA